MEEEFELPVKYKGEELMFPARLLHQGYTHRFEVEVNGQCFFFEPDEERNYRVLYEADKQHDHHQSDLELLKAIAAAIEAIVK